MSKSVHSLFRGTFRALVLVSFLALQGCLSYHESGELYDDGSGEIRIVFGLPNGTLETEKIRDARQAAKRLVGVHWIADVDSLSPGRHWHGSVFHFDSLPALRRFNDILPMESLFGGVKLIVTDSGTTMRRFVKLPADSKEDKETMTIDWVFPGPVVATDRHARHEAGSNRASWQFPTDGSAGETAKMEVRWEPRGIPVSLWTRMPKGRMEWAAAGLAAVTFLFSILAAVTARGRLRAVRRKLSNG